MGWQEAGVRLAQAASHATKWKIDDPRLLRLDALPSDVDPSADCFLDELWGDPASGDGCTCKVRRPNYVSCSAAHRRVASEFPHAQPGSMVCRRQQQEARRRRAWTMALPGSAGRLAAARPLLVAPAQGGCL